MKKIFIYIAILLSFASCFNQLSQPKDNYYSTSIFSQQLNSESTFIYENINIEFAIPSCWFCEKYFENDCPISLFFYDKDDVYFASLTVYKDFGNTYQNLLSENSILTGLSEKTYRNIEHKFAKKASYVYFSSPYKESNEGLTRKENRFYQLQFDKYVVSINLQFEYGSEHDKILCDNFIDSIKIS